MALDTDRLLEIAWSHIKDHGENVLTLEWDGGSAGNSGVHWVIKWNDFYFLTSSDVEPEGPFDSIDEVLDLDYFSYEGTPKPSLQSSVLPLRKLLKVAKGLVGDERGSISINSRQYERRGQRLRPSRGGAR